MGRSSETILITLILVGVFGRVRSDAFNHMFKIGELVPFYANMVGPFHNPSETYAYYELPHSAEIHKLRIISSSGTLLILVGCLVALYVQVLGRDLNKSASDEESVDNQEGTGWKIIHGDVFRYPKHKCFFAAAVGSGTQLFAGVVSIIILGMIGTFQPYNRVLKGALIITYAITNVIAGFASVSLYRQLEGGNQGKNLLLAGCVFSGPMCLTFGFLNTVAMTYGSSAALPSETIAVIILIFVLLALPLLLLGGIIGKMIKSEFQAPCRTSKCPREIPGLPWYRGVLPQMALAGFLPFGVCYIELYYIMASVWGHRSYIIYGVLFIVFILLVTTTAFVSVGLTYFQLAAEDYNWWWRSFLCGGSTALYVYAYCFYYYFERSDMTGFLQTSHFFGYMACICCGLFLLLGTVGFRASLVFVRFMYSSIKCD